MSKPTTQPRTRPALSILDLIRDRALLGFVFDDPSWRKWTLAAAVLFGLAHGLTPEEISLAAALVGGRALPTSQVREAWFVVGRRGGKSLFAALVAIYMACFRTYRLAPGERGVVMLIAADRRQARVVKRYISGLMHRVPMLSALIASETLDSIVLRNALTIEVHTASFRAVRGYTIVAAICDEIAFWPTDESANPDTEILNALRPAMATVHGALLLCLSSPYARKGELYRAYRDRFGKNDEAVLVWQADTRTMNPNLPQDVIDAAYAEDEAVASAEYGAEFRRDIETFLSRDAINAAVIPGRLELPPARGCVYSGFLDFAGGSGADSATCAIAHEELREGRSVGVLDVVREVRPPFSPEQTCEQFAALLKPYGVHVAIADRFAGEFPVERMRTHGVTVFASDRSKSDIYREFLPRLNSGTVELLDLPRLHAQLVGLERRVARGGRDSIDHAPGSHDDVANAAAGALVEVCVLGAHAGGSVGHALTQDRPHAVLTLPDRSAEDPVKVRIFQSAEEDREPGGVLHDGDPFTWDDD